MHAVIMIFWDIKSYWMENQMHAKQLHILK